MRPGNAVDERLLRGRDADHLQRRRVLEDADDGQADVLPGLLVEDLDRDRVEPLLEVEAGQLEVRKHAEVPVVAARDDRAVDDGEARRLANRRPDLLLRARSPARCRRGRTSCARGTAPSSPRTRYVSYGRPAPTCFASTASTDWLPTAVKSAGVHAGRAPQRRGHVVDRRRAGRPRANLESAAEVVDVDGVDERAVRRRARSRA